jgi:hypothetical protein
MERGVESGWPAETLTSTTPFALTETLSMDDAGEPMASLAGGLLISSIIPEIPGIDDNGLSGLSLLTEVLLDPQSKATDSNSNTNANNANNANNTNTDATSLIPAFEHSIAQIVSPLEILNVADISQIEQDDDEPGEKDDGGKTETVAPDTSGEQTVTERFETPDHPQQEHPTPQFEPMEQMEQMEQIGESSQSGPVHVSPEIQAQAKPGDIAAYFALEFLDMQYIYYMQRSSVSLGRGGIPGSRGGGPGLDGSGAPDIDLGPLKNISRLHARIEYEDDLERWVLVVIGRNGVFVDGVWIEPGRRMPLGDR